MHNNNDDLLEPYEDNSSEYDFFEESKENTSNIAYSFVMIGFLVLFGIKFIMSLSDTGPDTNAIVIRQVKLLDIIKNAQNEEEAQAAVIEYDSLSRVLDVLEAESD